MNFNQLIRDAWTKHFATLNRINYGRYRNAEAGNTKTWGSRRNAERLELTIRNLNGRRTAIYALRFNRDTGQYRGAHEYFPHCVYPIGVRLLDNNDEPDNWALDWHDFFIACWRNTPPPNLVQLIQTLVDRLMNLYEEAFATQRFEMYFDAVTTAFENRIMNNLAENAPFEEWTMDKTIQLLWIGALVTIRDAGY